MKVAFTLIETLVVIGVVMILIGLAVPSMAKSWQNARLTKALAVARSNFALIDAYATNYRCFPIAATNAYESQLRWWEALEASGAITDGKQVDPQRDRHNGVVTYVMSMCLVYDPARMTPGMTVPIDDALSRPVRPDQIVFPSAKGAMWDYFVHYDTNREYWCCTPLRLPGPVVFADSSAVVGSWQDFTLGQTELKIENAIGFPVASTWGGYLARDR